MTAVAAASIERTSLIQGVLEAYRHKPRKNSRCVLFVHGLTGHPETTWKNASSDRSFLELISSDENLQDYDVFSFGYRSKYIRGAPIENAAKQLHGAIEELAPDHYS